MTDREREILDILARLEAMREHGGDAYAHAALLDRLAELRGQG